MNEQQQQLARAWLKGQPDLILQSLLDAFTQHQAQMDALQSRITDLEQAVETMQRLVLGSRSLPGVGQRLHDRSQRDP